MGNTETAASNRFQRLDASADAATDQASAVAEFSALATALENAGIRVHVFEDTLEPHTPDAIFPNNWISFHADGTVVLYPMLAPNRRLERRMEIVAALGAEQGFAIKRIVDLTHGETRGRYLEGTGSLVLDRVNRIAYACLSPRTDAELLAEFSRQLDYEPVAFRATDAAGVPIYHTNVMLSVGTHFAAVCTAAIVESDRQNVVRRLRETGHEILDLTMAQMESFAGNLLELGSADASRVVALSAGALQSLETSQLQLFQRLQLRPVAVPLTTIERLGGGSARCMIAEIHLPVR